MGWIRRPSPQTVAVLRALATRPEMWRHGYALGQEIGLKAGSLYPILIRLAERGLLDAVWENDPQAGRPPRHLYRLTGTGVQLAGELADQPAGEWVVDRVLDRAGGRAVTTDPLGAARLGGAR